MREYAGPACSELDTATLSQGGMGANSGPNGEDDRGSMLPLGEAFLSVSRNGGIHMTTATSTQVFYALHKRAEEHGHNSHGHPLCILIRGREVFLCERHYAQPDEWTTRVVCIPPEDVTFYVGEEDARKIKANFPAFCGDQYVVNGDNYPVPEGFGSPVKITPK